MNIQIINGKIVRNDHIESADLWISNGKIIAKKSRADKVIDAEGMLIAPGYIDLQINGAHGFDFTSEPDSVEKVAAIIPGYGVTAFLPTIISTTPERYREIIPRINSIQKSNGAAAVLGMHLEGPFLDPLFAGAHKSEYFLQLKGNDPFMQCYGTLEGVKIMTLAPELSHARKWIKNLCSMGIVAAAGHTACTYKVIQRRFAAGISLTTHLFNAMSPFHHRAPALIGAVLSDRKKFYTIIADGVHVHPSVLKMAWQANGEGLILISDAIAAVGVKEGIYHLGDEKIKVSNGHAFLETTPTLAGSMLTLDAAVRNLRIMTGCSIAEAINAASFKPAKILGIEHQKGTLDIGCDADFLFLDKNLFVKQTYIAGQKYNNQS